MSLGERIQMLRKEKKMSQNDLAEKLDVSRQSVSKWETDTAKPELTKLILMAELFKYPWTSWFQVKSQKEMNVI